MTTVPIVQGGRQLLVIAVWMCAVVGVGGTIAASLIAGEPQGSVLAIVYALIPVPLLWAAFWWLDRVDPQPRRYIWGAFVWGAVVAVILAIALELAAAELFDLNDEVMAAVVAPLVEESTKGAFLLVTFLRARRVLNSVLDGVVLAGVVAFGFAAVENVLYYAGAWSEVESLPINITAAGAATATFVMRGLFTPLAHPLFSVALGVACGLMVARRTRIAKIAIVFAGWVVSVILHALWNGSIVLFGGLGLLIVYVVLMMYLCALAVMVILMRRKQLITLREALTHIGLRGWIHPDEVPYLVELKHRRTALKTAKSVRGKAGRRAVAQYQEVARRLAFEYDAVMRGRGPADGVARTYAWLDHLLEIRPAVVLPPPLYAGPGFAWAR